MRRQHGYLLALALFNLPWIGLWWYFTAPGQDRGPSVTALFMILTICTIGMVLLPMLVGGLGARRWLLILILGLTNLFWCLRWISVFAQTTPMDHTYRHARHLIAGLMVASSATVILLYLLIDGLLRRLGRRRDAPAAPPTPPPPPAPPAN